MAIYKEQIGNKEATVVSFGSGDIMISPCEKVGAGYMDQLWFTQDVEKPESEWDKDPGNKSTDELSDHLPIIFKFAVTKSIDTLIEQLLVIKDSMLNKTNNGNQ